MFMGLLIRSKSLIQFFFCFLFFVFFCSFSLLLALSRVDRMNRLLCWYLHMNGIQRSPDSCREVWRRGNGVLRASQVAEWWRICLPMQEMQEMWVESLGWEDPHSSILAWRIPWTEERGGLQSMGSQTVGHVLACPWPGHAWRRPVSQ